MNENKLISVVIITYNHEKYIQKALESVIEQNLFQECEVIIGDDGSSDNTVKILRTYEEEYSNIEVYAHENVGISRNVYDLFRKCQGEYIAILEGDDYWTHPNKLDIQIEQIKKNGCIASASNSRIVDDDGNEYGLKNKRTSGVILGKKEVEKFQTSLLMPSGLLFRNIFRGETDRYTVIRDASRMGGNHSGMINLLGSLGKIYLDNEPYCVWRKNDMVPGSNYSSKKHDSIEELHESMGKYFMYKKEFDMNYDTLICSLYSQILDKLKEEIVCNLGYKKILKFKIRRVLSKIYHKCLAR